MTGRHTDRGVAGLLDFLTAMVIVVGAISVYFAASAVLIDVQDDRASGVAHAGLRVQERLVDDVFRSEPGARRIAPGCVRSFFAYAGNRSCGFVDRGSGQAYLRGVLGIGESYELNVTLEDSGGVVNADPSGGERPFRHAVGPPTPRDGDVSVYYRIVTFGRDTDYYTVYVRLWEAS